MLYPRLTPRPRTVTPTNSGTDCFGTLMFLNNYRLLPLVSLDSAHHTRLLSVMAQMQRRNTAVPMNWSMRPPSQLRCGAG